MNRWIEIQNDLYNIDNFDKVFIRDREIQFRKNDIVMEYEIFKTREEAIALYEEIKSKLNLKKWE